MLPTPTVIIEQAPDVPAEIRQAVLNGCGRGLGERGCLEKSDTASPEAPYEAELVWSENYQQVRIIVLLHPGRLEREIQFQSTDRPIEKGAAAGLVAATTVATHLSLQEEPGPPPAPSAPPEPAPRETETLPTTSEAKPPLTLRTDLALTLGSGLRDGPLAWGVAGRASMSGWAKPLFPMLALSYSRSGGSITSTSWRTWLGLGVELDISELPLALELSGACIGEYFSITGSQEGETDKASTLRIGGLLQSDLVWKASHTVHFFLGGQASLLWPDAEITTGNEPVDYQGVFDWTALSGVRLRLQ